MLKNISKGVYFSVVLNQVICNEGY